MKLPKAITKLIDSFERLPGIGPKSAQRLTFYLMNFPQEELEKFAEALTHLKQETRLCEKCKNISEDTICSVCSDSARNQDKILVVSTILDTFALEKTGFDGVYHVLHGVIDPLNNIGPEEIFIKDLVSRVGDLIPAGELSYGQKAEIILATSSSLEGESTAMYITKLLRGSYDDSTLKITRIARGIPVGGDIEYADDITLSRALDGRAPY